MFGDYGAVESQEVQVIKIYKKPEPSPYFENIQNALKVYGCAVRDEENSDLDSTIAVVRMIIRLCQDQHVTSNLEFVGLSNI